MILKELTFSNFHLGVWCVFQNVFCNRFNFGVGCGGVERTNFEQFLHWREGVMVLKELIFNSFYFGWIW